MGSPVEIYRSVVAGGWGCFGIMPRLGWCRRAYHAGAHDWGHDVAGGGERGRAAAMATPLGSAGPARRLAVGGGVAEVAVSVLMERRIGSLVAEPYSGKGRAATLSKAAAD